MGCLHKVVVGSVVIVVLAIFFFAPVVYWYTETCQTSLVVICPTDAPTYPVYQSPGCATIGVGTVYSPHWFGLSLGCQISYPYPYGSGSGHY